MKPDSHILKHYLDIHKEEEMEELEIGTRIVKECTTAFNRQICESVEIQNNLGHHILNSKSEYNRCALPRLTADMGEKTSSTLEKEKREEREREKELAQEIRNLKLRRSHNRREKLGQRTQPAEKKRKTGENNYIKVLQPHRTGDRKREKEEEQKETTEKKRRTTKDETEDSRKKNY